MSHNPGKFQLPLAQNRGALQDQNRRNCRGDPSRRSGTASIIRINPRLAAGLDIDPHIQRTRMPEIPHSASDPPDGVSLPLTENSSSRWPKIGEHFISRTNSNPIWRKFPAPCQQLVQIIGFIFGAKTPNFFI